MMKKILILCILVFWVTFLYGCQKKIVQNQITKETEKIQQTETTKEIDRNNPIIYTNSKYWFTLTLPKTWMGYTVTEDIRNDEMPTAFILFNYSDRNGMFDVVIFTKKQWQESQEDMGSARPYYLWENSQYVFASNSDEVQDPSNDPIWIARRWEVLSIMETFKIIKQ